MKLYLSLILGCLFAIQVQSQSQDSPKITTADIDRFYLSFDLALKDTVHALNIFNEHYFRQGSKGLRDFLKYKIKDREKFVETVMNGKDFYISIREVLSEVRSHEATLNHHFNAFKEVYPQAISGQLYFVVGRLNSNGTIVNNRLIIGTELVSKTAQNSTSWVDALQQWVLPFDHLPVTVFHEMVHINQKGMKQEKTLLSYSLREGGAEFLTELFTGKTDGNYSGFKGRELDVWNDFTKEMHLDVYTSWHQANEPLRPRNALYWTGYLICKSYYESAEDKKQAVHDILNIKKSIDFYQKSDIENYLKLNYSK